MTHENPIISFAIIPSLHLLKMTQQSTDRACQCLQLILKIRSSTDQKILKRSSTVPLQILKSSSKGPQNILDILLKFFKRTWKAPPNVLKVPRLTMVLQQHRSWCNTCAGAKPVLVQHRCLCNTSAVKTPVLMQYQCASITWFKVFLEQCLPSLPFISHLVFYQR